jgi:siderophore synthetase component
MNVMNAGHAKPSLSEKVVSHLDPRLWARANRLLIRKAIAEFAHELLFVPRPVSPDNPSFMQDWAAYRLDNARGGSEYRFRARRMSLDHWHIDTGSIERWRDGRAIELDALDFIIEFKEMLGIRDSMMAVYLDEISSILYGSTYKTAHKPHRAEDLAHAAYQAIETGMTEGHPTFVANNGRIGFDTIDYPAYAPEAAGPLQLVWLAVRRENATFTCVSALSYDSLIREELGPETIEAFNGRLRQLGLDPLDYYVMPVHPWQWFNRISMSFSPEMATHAIVCLGLSPDHYQPQQSIRTFFNISQPQKRYVKTALSILNMGFMLMRGLSPDDMLATPVFNDWVCGIVEKDTYLRSLGFSLICEVATIGYRNRYYEAGLKGDSPYKHMLSALWRESPTRLIGPGERLMTMAALLHLDPQGKSLAAALIKSSGLSPEDWIARYLRAYLTPLLHCFYAYDMIFMPHGENVILVIKEDAPARIVMKDLAEEMRILTDGAGLPPEVRRNCTVVEDQHRLSGIFTDVFDCFFRYFAAILDEEGLLPERRFWGLVADCVRTYQAENPQFHAKFERFDLFVPEFPRNCINRLQLRDNQQLIDPNDPNKGFEYAGTLPNPLLGA